MTKTRGLLLSRSRLIFLSLKPSPQFHSEISLRDVLDVQGKDAGKFYVKTRRGILHLDEPGYSEEWVTLIKSLSESIRKNDLTN